MNKDGIIKTVNAINSLKEQLEEFLNSKINLDQITHLEVKEQGLEVVTEYQYDPYDPPSEKIVMITWETLEKLQTKSVPENTNYYEVF